MDIADRGWVIYNIVLTILLQPAVGNFLGGTVSWMNVPGNRVRFTYRLCWEKGTGPCGSGCDLSKLGILGTVTHPQLSPLRWSYSIGNTSAGALGDVNSVLTSVSVSNILGWEQGENTFNTTIFARTSGSVFLSGLPWIRSGNDTTSTGGYMEAAVDTRPRTDTHQPNNSPYSSLPPYFGVAFNCATTLRLPVEDPDGDIVRCRWATASECGAGCSNMPQGTITLNKVTCEVTIHALAAAGYTANTTYRLALVIEDTPHYVIKMGLDTVRKGHAMSRVPLQMTVRIQSTTTCGIPNLQFVRPTVKNFARVSYMPTFPFSNRTSIQIGIYLSTNDVNNTEFMVSSPMYMRYDPLPDDLRRANVTRVRTFWLPRRQQGGNQQFCFWGRGPDGVTTDARCITDIVMDRDNCKTTHCYNNATCFNVFGRSTPEICDCPHGYKTRDCAKRMTCTDLPCENNSTCQTAGSTYTCSCTAGYHGADCEQEMLDCNASPCQHNGTCIDLHGSYRCVCESLYTGQHCETGHTAPDVSEETGDGGWSPGVIAAVVLGCVCGVAILLAAGYWLLSRPHSNKTQNGDQELTENNAGPSVHSNDHNHIGAGTSEWTVDHTANLSSNGTNIYHNQAYGELTTVGS